MKQRILLLATVFLLMISLFAGCMGGEGESMNEEMDPTEKGIVLDVKEALMVTGESFVISHAFTPAESEEKEVEYSVEGDAVHVDDEGRVTAIKAGEAKVIVSEKEGDRSAQCAVIVGDIIVQKGSVSEAAGESGEEQFGEGTPTAQPNIGGREGETLFPTLTQALAHATEGAVILVQEGSYSETPVINKKVTVKGMGNVFFSGMRIAAQGDATLSALKITANAFPQGNDALVYLATGAKLEMKDCSVQTTATGTPEGGYAIYAEKQCKGLSVQKCVLGNFRYGIYVCPTDQTITVKENKLSNLQVGIGVDIRQENSAENYPAHGEITDNEFNEVQTKTQFFHYGEEYEGELDFGDHQTQDEPQTSEPNGLQE